MSSPYTAASFGEEVGGYNPRQVDKALKEWAVYPPDVIELREARFTRAPRGYKRADVDDFIEAMITGQDPPPASSQWASMAAQTVSGAAMVAPLLLVFALPEALRTGSLLSSAESAGCIGALALFVWQWRQGGTGAHERRD